jgi:hypothetical protein
MTGRVVPCIAGSVLMIIAIVFAGCAEDLAVEIMDAATSVPVLTNDDWPLVHADAEEIDGRQVELRGRVFRASEPSNTNEVAFLVWVDFDNDRLPTAFVVRGPPTVLTTETFVEARGVVEGRELYGYPDGREVVVPRIRVTALTVTDRLGIRPAIQVVGIGQPLTQLGIQVTLERIEFAMEETRLLFTIENRRDETVNAIGTRLAVRQGEAEYRAVFPIGNGVPPPRGRVEAGAIQSGWFQFPPLDRKGPRLVITWRGVRAESIALRFQPWQWVVDVSGGELPQG